MENKIEDKCRLLAETISAIFRNGVTLNRETLHFVDSTYSTESVQSLEEMMNAEGDDDADVLYSLIFYPDEFFQEQLEEMLETESFEKGDDQKALNYLLGSLPETMVRFPDNRGTLHLTMPEPVAAQFISRLNLFKGLNRRLIEEISRSVPDHRQLRTKVKLRNARFEETESRISFLCRFFEKMPDDDGRCLDFVLDLFEENRDEDDVYALLKNRKQLYFRNIQKADRFQDMLRKHNMETLMTQGVRIPHIDREETVRKMDIVDRISQAVFGKTEYFLDSRTVLEEGGFTPGVEKRR